MQTRTMERSQPNTIQEKSVKINYFFVGDGSWEIDWPELSLPEMGLLRYQSGEGEREAWGDGEVGETLCFNLSH